MEDPKALENPFFELPQELIWKMLYHLPPKDAVHFCFTHRGAAQIICHDNNFWFEKIMRDFGKIYEIKREDIPVKDRYGTYKSYWEDAHEKLILCAESGNRECVESLLWLGIDLDHQNKWGGTALMFASWNNAEIVRLLLEHAANADIQNTWGTTALIRASAVGRADIVRLLLEHRADPDIQNSAGTTSLLLASQRGHVDIVQLLLEHNADLDIQDYLNRTAFDWALRGGHMDIVRLLKDRS